MIADYAQIQPLRFFVKDEKLKQHNYYEKNHFNIKHSLVYATNDRFIPFAFNIPTRFNVISECKLYCPNESTVAYNLKTKLINATDLKIISYTNAIDGTLAYRVQFACLEVLTDLIPNDIVYCYIKVINPGTGEYQEYISDFVHIIENTKLVDQVTMYYEDIFNSVT